MTCKQKWQISTRTQKAPDKHIQYKQQWLSYEIFHMVYRWECKIQVCIPTFSHSPWTAWMHTNATLHKLSPALKKTLIALNHLRHSSTQGMKQIMIFECNQLQDFFYELRLHSSLYYNQRQLKDHLKYNSHPLACKQHNLSWLKNPNCSQEFDLYKSISPKDKNSGTKLSLSRIQSSLSRSPRNYSASFWSSTIFANFFPLCIPPSPDSPPSPMICIMPLNSQ